MLKRLPSPSLQGILLTPLNSIAESAKAVPLTCHGHSRPVTHLSFSSIVDDDVHYLISACKGTNRKLCHGIDSKNRKITILCYGMELLAIGKAITQIHQASSRLSSV